jgi:hypothetical protein
VSEITSSNININSFIIYLDRWLQRGSLSKQSSTATASASVTDVVSESQRFASPSSIGSSRIAESSKHGSTMIPICPWVLRIQVIKSEANFMRYYRSIKMEVLHCVLAWLYSSIMCSSRNVHNINTYWGGHAYPYV